MSMRLECMFVHQAENALIGFDPSVGTILETL